MIIIYGTTMPLQGWWELPQEVKESVAQLSVGDPLALLILQWGLTNTVYCLN